MLGYRAFSTVKGEPQLIDRTMAQLYAWLKGKGYDVEALREGGGCDLTPTVRGRLTSLSGQDGSSSMRASIVETQSRGTWSTDLTVHVPSHGRGDPWFWLDIDGPEDNRRAATPRLARALFDVLDCHDGLAKLTAAPQSVDVYELPSLIAALEDPSRRGLVFVAGTSSDLPLPPWSELVAGILRETTGLAAAYVLDSEATARFADAVGKTHEVVPGVVRTFQSGVKVGDELDARRHRILTTARIVRSDGRFLRRLLGDRARDTAIEAQLPSAAVRLDRRFRSHLDEQLLRSLRVEESPTPVVPAPREVGAPAQRVVDDAELVGSAERLLLAAVVADVLGTDVTSDALTELGVLARLGRQAQESRDRLAGRITTLEEQVDAARRAERRMRDQRDDVLLDQELAEAERADSERSVRYLRSQLLELGRSDVAYGLAEAEALDVPPESFDDLLVRVEHLEHVVHTGDEDVVRGLDRHAVLGTWARKVWEALLALEDYARESLAGRCPRDVDGYLANLPDGCRGFSPKRHAQGETGAVGNTARYRNPRMLPVPPEVAEEGRVYMGAHFKIAQYGMVSPRVHYFDDTARTGKVYVGHIGPHLPTASTN